MRRPWRQVAAMFAVATIIAWSSAYWRPGIWNGALWLGSSIAIAFFANKGVARLLFAVVLAMVFLPALIANEAAAHLLFGICLQD